MAKIQLKQVRSSIGRSKRQKANLEALGLRKINATVVHESSPSVLGMVEKVRHLVEVTEL